MRRTSINFYTSVYTYIYVVRQRNGHLYTTVTPTEKQRILELISQDIYLNIPDFVRQAVREKLKETEK